MSGPAPLLITADDVLLDHALAVCAAAGVEPELVADLGQARSRWTSASILVVGADQGHRVLDLDLPRRSNVLLVDVEDSGRDLTTLSVRLGAPVVLLPGGSAGLSATLAAGVGGSTTRARVVAVVGGSGGVGASTVSTALAVVAARSGRRTMLVDLDPLGGGIDLLLGAERATGWRWPRLLGARGQLGDLTGQLPHTDGLDLVAMARCPATPRSQHPTPEAVAAVLTSGSRSHELVVVDVGRVGGEPAAAALRLADTGLLLVAADVRGVSAAREAYREVAESCAGWHLLVRRPRAGGLGASAAADGLGPALLGVIDDDPGLALAAQRGTPPARSSRSQLARVCRQVLASVVWPAGAAA